MKKILAILLFVAAFSGCVKETTWDIGDGEKKVVVDGILTDEPGVQVIRLQYSVAELNAVPEPVTGAEVIINTEDSSFVLTEDTLQPGVYQTRPGFSAEQEKTYTLQIFHQGNLYSAKAEMMPGITFDPLQYVQEPGKNMFHVSFVASAFSPDDPAMWEVLLDWSQVPGYSPGDSLVNRARLLFYTLPTIDVTEIFAPEMEKVSFPAGTIVTQKRYSLTSAHASFVRELLSETTWQGGLFNTMPSDVSTNLSNGATGWFGVCGVRTLSFTIAGK